MTNKYDDTIKKALRDNRITSEQYGHLFICQELIGNCDICKKLVPVAYMEVQED